MATPLPPEQQASYAVIIDEILAVSDLNTVSAKRIRKGLQDRVGYDLTAQKKAITDLIMERFDKYQKDHPTAVEAAAVPERAPTANGGHRVGLDDLESSAPHSPPPKRKAETEDDAELSEVQDSPPPKKVKKIIVQETDEQMAKRMQAELNVQARATRGGGPKKKPPPVRKQMASKKKSAAKVHSDDDSDVDGKEGSKPAKERNTGFHKPLNLSEPLQALLGESQLSRPQTVKRIWEYVKKHDLQQPDDKRNIICDDALRAVFKADKVHMFTMNKILATQLYPVDD